MFGKYARFASLSLKSVALAAAVAAVSLPALNVRADDPKAADEKSENRDFLKRAHQAGETEVAVSKLAATNSENADVKKLGEMMVKDHEAVNKQLEAIAKDRKMTLGDKGISAHDQETVDRLNKLKGKEFDAAWLLEQVAMHNEAIELFSKEEKQSVDAKLDKLVKDTLPTLREHRKHAEDLKKALD